MNLRTLTLLLLASGSIVACGPAPREAVPEPEDSGAVLSPDEADPVVARGEGTLIRRSDVEREALAQDSENNVGLQPGDPEFQRVLEELIDQRLLALEARRRGLHRSEEARRRLALAEERILGNVLLETALADAVSGDTIERIYQEQIRLIPLGEEIRARHILVDTRAEADAIAQLLADGRDFAELAVAMSQDPATRLEGGDLGYFTRQGILPSFGAVAFATPEGGISQPFQTESGWHILQVVDRRRQPPPSLEQMRPVISQFYMYDQLAALVDELRLQAEIERPELTAPPAPDADADAAPEDEPDPDSPEPMLELQPEPDNLDSPG